MSSITASGRPASLGGLLVALLTMLSLGIQQPAAAQDVDLRSLRNPLQDPRGSHHPRWITFPPTCGIRRGCSRPMRFAQRGTRLRRSSERSACQC